MKRMRQLLSLALSACLVFSLAAPAVAADAAHPATRGEVFAALYTLEGAPTAGQDKAAFSDLTGKSYSAAAHWAAFVGLTSGTGAGLFDGDRPITRQELSKVLADYASYKFLARPEGGMAMKEAPDYEKIAPWALNGMSYCYYSGVLTADAAGNLQPTATITAEALTAAMEKLAALSSIKVDTAEKKAPTLKTPLTTPVSSDLKQAVPVMQDTAKLETAITVSAKASGVMLAEAFDPAVTEYDLNALAAGADLTLNVKAPTGTKITVNGKDAQPGKDVTVPVERIAKDNDITVVIGSATYTIHTYSRQLPVLDYTLSESAKPADGVYTLALEPFLLRMNTKGELLYYRSMACAEGQMSENFRPVQYEDGTIRFTYFVELDPALREAQNGYSSGMYVIMDEHYTDMKSVTLAANGWHGAGYLDQHDFLLLSDNHWISLSYTRRDVDNVPAGLPTADGVAHVQAGIIQEVKDGKVVMEFDTTNHPFLYATSTEKHDYTAEDYQDYVHINSVSIDPKDGNLILSMRHQYAIYKIDRKTGDILWILGGTGDQFGLAQSQKFVGQHAASYTTDGTVTLFNNNTFKGLTKLVELTLDEGKQTVLDYKAYSVRDYAGNFCGNIYETASGSHMIGWGMNLQNTAPVFSEVDPATGEVLSNLFTKAPTPAPYFSYRTYKSEF